MGVGGVVSVVTVASCAVTSGSIGSGLLVVYGGIFCMGSGTVLFGQVLLCS